MALNSSIKVSPGLGGKVTRKATEMNTHRHLRTRSAGAVLCSQDNKMCYDKKDRLKSRKMSLRACSTGSENDSGIDVHSPLLRCVKGGIKHRNLHKTKVIRKTKTNNKKSILAALKIYDYPEDDPETENIPQRVRKKKSPAKLKSGHKFKNVEDRLNVKRTNKHFKTPASSKSGISSSHFCGRKSASTCKSQNSTPVSKTVKADRGVRKVSVFKKVSEYNPDIPAELTTVNSKHAITKNEERHTLSFPKHPSDDAIDPTPSPRDMSEITNITTFLSSFSFDVRTTTPYRVCEPGMSFDSDDSEVIVNFSKTPREQGIHCNDVPPKTEQLHDTKDDSEIPCETVPFGVTSTPEKNGSSEMACEYSFFMDSSVNETMEVTLYDSPEKLSPIKNVASPASSVSNDSCYFDEFSSRQGGTAETDKTTPKKTDVQESVLRSAKAYHTPHQFRRHLFGGKGKEKIKPQKKKSPAEVKLDMWASLMNSHFEEVEDSELVVE